MKPDSSPEAKLARFNKWVAENHAFCQDVCRSCQEVYGMTEGQVRAEFQRMRLRIRLAPASKYNYVHWGKFIKATFTNRGAERFSRSLPDEVGETRVYES